MLSQAIERCFGRDYNSNTRKVSRCTHSAYMLVYIKEAQAPIVMQPLPLTDVPEELVNRIKSEKIRQDIDRLKLDLADPLIQQSYYLEADIAALHKFNEKNDHLWVSRNAHRLSMLGPEPTLTAVVMGQC